MEEERSLGRGGEECRIRVEEEKKEDEGCWQPYLWMDKWQLITEVYS